jgi:uncharacterized protein (DUF1684 family)
MTDTEQWAERLRANRREKDEFFAEHPQSPIPPDEREGFDGLAYFDPDPDYRVDATVTVHEAPDPVELETSDGRTVRYLRVATFAFDLGGEARELHGYRQQAGDDAIFVPFRDKTTGQETYEGGRYMELEPDRALADGDRITVDFNLAYSPFCAFSETFSCPYPPEENWLETTVPAGERHG